MTGKPDETDVDGLLELGISLCRRARWREAIEPLQRAVAIDGSKALAHYQLGEAYNATDRLNEALEAYQTASSLQPDNWRALKGIGVVLDRLHRPDEASAAHRRAREMQRR